MAAPDRPPELRPPRPASGVRRARVPGRLDDDGGVHAAIVSPCTQVETLEELQACLSAQSPWIVY